MGSADITPPGQYPPFAVITPTDHAAWIIIAAALGTSLSVLFLGIRIFIRSSSNSQYGTDDLLVAIATVFSIAQAGLILSACHTGLGKSASLLTSDALTSIQQRYYASNLVYIAGLTLSKATVACFILRLTPIHAHTYFMKCALGALAVWGVVFVFVLAFVCDLSQPWLLLGQECHGYYMRWIVLESLGCIYEVAIFAMSLWLVWSLQTSFSNKVTVIVTFGGRLLLIVIIALRLASFDKAGHLTNPTLLEAPFIVWTCTELNYSIISATFPIIRPFINNLTTNYGGRGSVFDDSQGSSAAGCGRSQGRRSQKSAGKQGYLLNEFHGRDVPESSAKGHLTDDVEPDMDRSSSKNAVDDMSIVSSDSTRVILRENASSDTDRP